LVGATPRLALELIGRCEIEMIRTDLRAGANYPLFSLHNLEWIALPLFYPQYAIFIGDNRDASE